PASNDQTEAKTRRDWVLDRMVTMAYLSPEAAYEFKQKPIGLKLTEPPNDCVSVNPAHNDYGFFCDMFKNWWRDQAAFGPNPAAREENLRRGGYAIVTSLDPNVQNIAYQQVVAKEGTGSSFAHGVVAIKPGTGQIQAAAVNRVYAIDQSHNGANTDPNKRRAGVPGSYPQTVNPLLGGSPYSGGYQAGSTS